jgi:hypothetical protein
LPWSRIAHELGALKAARYHTGGRTIVQRTKIFDSLGKILKRLGVSMPKKILSIADPDTVPAATETHARNSSIVTYRKSREFQGVCLADLIHSAREHVYTDMAIFPLLLVGPRFRPYLAGVKD